MRLKSMSFKNDALIPPLHSCDGSDQSPHLTWSNLPEKTKSLALIMEDPHAAAGGFVHWVGWNVDPRAYGLKAKIHDHARETLITQGKNSVGKHGYTGPCATFNSARMVIKVYALDTALALPKTTTKEELLDAMKDHILDSAEFVGRYRQGNSQ